MSTKVKIHFSSFPNLFSLFCLALNVAPLHACLSHSIYPKIKVVSYSKCALHTNDYFFHFVADLVNTTTASADENVTEDTSDLPTKSPDSTLDHPKDQSDPSRSEL